MALVSILGDSISTFQDYNPDGYEVYYDEYYQARNRLTGVKDTWWGRVMDHFGWELCVNNSYSGSRASGVFFPSASSEERLTRLKTDEISPDYIIVYIGFNDFGYGVDVGESVSSEAPHRRTFYGAYEYMIAQIKKLYPEAKVICGTLMRSKIKYDPDWFFPEQFSGIPLEKYNQAIRDVCQRTQVSLADLSVRNERYETLDGAHPTADGHAVIAEAWIDCLERLNPEKPAENKA